MERQNKIITVCIIYQFLLGVKDAGEQGAGGAGNRMGGQNDIPVSDFYLVV